MNQPLNAAQIERAQKYALELVQGVQLRKWAVETALKEGGDMDLASKIYAFITTEISAGQPAHMPQAEEPSSEAQAARQRHIAERAAQ